MSVPEEGRFLSWQAAGPSSALSPLPGASPGAGESLISMRMGGGWRAEGGRERGAGATAGTCGVTGAQQYSLVVSASATASWTPAPVSWG